MTDNSPEYEKWLNESAERIAKFNARKEECEYCFNDPVNLVRATCICTAVHAPCHVCESSSITCPKCDKVYTADD